jgi:DNA repair protein RecO (recombination protein O)
MHWEDEGAILFVSRFSEHSALVEIFTRAHGLSRGLAKGAFAKQKRGIFQPGNIVHCRWGARLDDQLGTWQVELVHPVASQLLSRAERLHAFHAASQLIKNAMLERDPHPVLHAALERLLLTLLQGEPWLQAYVNFEMTLLNESGFGLDLTQCAATGKKDDLIYVSPKSGRAVSKEAGLPYHNRLFPLPPFLADQSGTENMPQPAEILDALQLTGYFLESRLFDSIGRMLPAARDQMIEKIKTHYSLNPTFA